MSKITKIILFTSLTISMFSCVVYSFKGGIIPGKTFSITNFPNNANTVNPNLSNMVFDALRQKILSESSLKFVPDLGDAFFDGKITGYTITPVQATGNDFSELSRLTITLSVIYTNEIDPSINYEKSFNDFQDFNSSEDFNSIEDEIVESILKKLVDQIYNEAMVGW